MGWVPYFKVAFAGLSDKEEVGKDFQGIDSRASLGSVNDFPNANRLEIQTTGQGKIAGEADFLFRRCVSGGLFWQARLAPKFA
jgi:hypothetical protein